MSVFRKLWARLTGAQPTVAAPPVEPEPVRKTSGDEVAESPTEEKPRSTWTAADDARLEQDARTLADEGRVREATDLLTSKGLVLAGHAASGDLPCLCRRCLVPDMTKAEVDGIEYTRDFVVAGRRVLFYWVPLELDDDATKLRYSMRTGLRDRVNELRLEARRRKHREQEPPLPGKIPT
jgi:hypothetical protein